MALRDETRTIEDPPVPERFGTTNLARPTLDILGRELRQNGRDLPAVPLSGTDLQIPMTSTNEAVPSPRTLNQSNREARQLSSVVEPEVCLPKT